MDLNNSKEVFIGIDVPCAKRKLIPIVFAVKERHKLVPLSVMKLRFRAPLGPGNSGVINNGACQSYA